MSSKISLKRLWHEQGGQIFGGDRFVDCAYCGVVYPLKLLTKDHVYPRSKGGPSRTWNLVLACRECNVKKGDTVPDKLPSVKKMKRLKQWLLEKQEIGWPKEERGES